jgi:hypothetical protein
VAVRNREDLRPDGVELARPGCRAAARLTRKFGGVMSTVMVPIDYPVQPGDTIYVLERFF